MTYWSLIQFCPNNLLNFLDHFKGANLDSLSLLLFRLLVKRT